MSEWLRTGIGHSDADSITLLGRSVPDDLMGRLSISELAFLLVRKRPPEPGEARMLDAVLVSLADHGLTPIALAARLTYTGAPDSLQGAIASGLLGGGSVFLGVVEDAARFLGPLVAEGDATPESAKAAVRARLDGGARVPGLGHPVHKVEDPRTPRIYELAEETGTLGPHLRALELVAAANRELTGRALPINGAGAGGAALADLGLPAPLLRGFVLLARTAGLLGHLAEEMEQPIGMRLATEIDARAVYDPPTGSSQETPGSV